MDWLTELYANQPFWVWLTVGLVILAAELATGSGWLLWPAVSAGIVAYLTLLGVDVGLPGEIGLFAVLTIAATFASRRFLKRRADVLIDVNEPGRLVGRTGLATSDFVGGYGRVAVEGCEWAAELEGEQALPEGAKVEVAALADGARLVVRKV
ncbi:MAG TPA: NfeD family protein [Caulobacteraceae bacterium]|jgi:hypothetical protein